MDNNNKYEELGCYIRDLFLNENNHQNNDDINFICDFVEEIINKNDLNKIDSKYNALLKKYMEIIKKENIELYKKINTQK